MLLVVLATNNLRSFVEQVLQFAAVDFIEGEVQLEVRVLVKQVDDVVSRQKVQTRHRAIGRPHHRECLAAAGLAVREAGGLCAFEGFNYEGQHGGFVDCLVVLVGVKNIVELKGVLFNELGQVHFGSAALGRGLTLFLRQSCFFRREFRRRLVRLGALWSSGAFCGRPRGSLAVLGRFGAIAFK